MYNTTNTFRGKELIVYRRAFSVSVKAEGGFEISESAGCPVDEKACGLGKG
jgi:hypothetical protein